MAGRLVKTGKETGNFIGQKSCQKRLVYVRSIRCKPRQATVSRIPTAVATSAKVPVTQPATGVNSQRSPQVGVSAWATTGSTAGAAAGLDKASTQCSRSADKKGSDVAPSL